MELITDSRTFQSLCDEWIKLDKEASVRTLIDTVICDYDEHSCQRLWNLVAMDIMLTLI